MGAQFLKKSNPDSKSDLFAAFIERVEVLVRSHGFMAQVTMQSWMFLSSYEKLRTRLLEDTAIVSLLHMDNMVMRIAFGTSATVWQIHGNPERPGAYTYIEVQDLLEGKPRTFPAENDRTTAAENGLFSVFQSEFASIPGSPIVYWLGEKMRRAFAEHDRLGNVAVLAVGLQTGDNSRFLRQWWEVPRGHTAFACTSFEEAVESGARWFPYNKGGEFRKWYGNQEFVVNWGNDGAELRAFRPRSVIRNPETYFSPSVSWSKVSSGAPAFREYPPGFIFDVAGTSIFLPSQRDRSAIIAFANSQVAYRQLAAVAPTLNFEVGQVAGLPIVQDTPDEVIVRASALIDHSREDWDTFESSWDFSQNPLVRLTREGMEHTVL